MELQFKHQILNAIVREIQIIEHLSVKVTPEKLDFRMMPDSRSIKELMQYLTYCSVSATRYYIEDDLSLRDAYLASKEKYEAYPIEEFRATMYEQFAEIRQLFNTITDEDLLTKEVLLPWKETMTMGEAMLHTTVKYLASYRMQFFLALKMSGCTELNTYDCWIGNKELLDKRKEALAQQS